MILSRLNWVLFFIVLSLSACNSNQKKVETGSKDPATAPKVEEKTDNAEGDDADSEDDKEDDSDVDEDTGDTDPKETPGASGIGGILPKILPLIKSIMSGGMPDFGSIMSIFADLIGGGGGLSGGGLDE